LIIGVKALPMPLVSMVMVWVRRLRPASRGSARNGHHPVGEPVLEVAVGLVLGHLAVHDTGAAAVLVVVLHLLPDGDWAIRQGLDLRAALEPLRRARHVVEDREDGLRRCLDLHALRILGHVAHRGTDPDSSVQFWRSNPS